MGAAEQMQAASALNDSRSPPRSAAITVDRPMTPPKQTARPALSFSNDDKKTRPSIGREDDAQRTSSQTHNANGVRTPIRRDSLKRREAVLKGEEGSRARRRWENDRLLDNPWAAPPLPSDWEVRPTHTHKPTPYYLAPLWDSDLFHQRIQEKLANKKSRARKAQGIQHGSTSSAEEDAAANVPKEVRAKLKRAKAAKGLLQDLEEEVRLFLLKWKTRELNLQEVGLGDAPDTSKMIDSDFDMSDSEKDEVVFIGRNGAMHDSPGRKKRRRNTVVPDEPDERELGRDKLVFDGLAGDRGAAFGRWLVHSIATYYGIESWSITVGDPARREAYVGLGERTLKPGAGPKKDIKPIGLELPRPLWGMV